MSHPLTPANSSVSNPSGHGRGDSYRTDINALRALAVSGVVACHVGVPGFTGGFFGVDVFFVISGYLITRLLLEEFGRTQTIDLMAFYERRVRRLLPALFLVAVSTVLLGAVFLTSADGELRRLSDSFVATLLFYSNWHFASVGGGYFDAPSTLYPLLHTWSLAVEEQFYVLWPLILLAAGTAAARLGRELRVLGGMVIALVLCASLAATLMTHAAGGASATSAFYSLLFRAWELAAGALLACVSAQFVISMRAGQWTSLVGFALILVSFVMFDERHGFPHPAAVLPVLGAICVVLGGAEGRGAALSHLLANRPVQFIGLVSYSWYLWHWPLLAITRSASLEMHVLWRDAALALLALVLAGLSYYFVEEPFRRRRVAPSWSARSVVASGVGMSLVLSVCASLSIQAVESSKGNRLQQIAAAESDVGWSRERCYRDSDTPYEGLLPRADCLEPAADAGQKLVVLWGDSHADHLAGALMVADREDDYAVLSRVQGLCPPLLGVVPVKRGRPFEACAAFNRDVATEIVQLHEAGHLDSVVISAHWALYTDTPKLAGGRGVALWKDGRRFNKVESLQALRDGLQGTLSFLAQSGIRVLVIAPMPEQEQRVPACLSRHSLDKCSAARELAEGHRLPALKAVSAAVASVSGVVMYDPLPLICASGECLSERDGVVLYWDADHLTYSGSRWLGKHLAGSSSWKSFQAN